MMMLKPERKTMITEYSCPFGGKKFEDEQWIYKHPGGYNNLQSAYEVESDASNMLFLSYHMGHNISNSYIMGDKYGYELPQQTPMYRELNEIWINTKKKYWIHGIINQLYTLSLTFLIPATFIWYVYYGTFLSRVIYGALALSNSFAIHHIRLHKGKMYQNKTLDKFFAPIYEVYMNIFFLFPARRWIDVHNKSHHIYTNSTEDNDVWMAYPFLYESKYYKILKFHRFQALYIPLVFGIIFFSGPIRQIVPRNPITGKRIGHWKYIILHVVFNVFVPYYSHGGLSRVICYYLFCSVFYSMCYAYLFQISHNQDKLTHFQYGKNKKSIDIMTDYDEWIRQQIESSMSYNSITTSDNVFGKVFDYCFTMFFGGINTQLEHHIAPATYPVYYFLVAKEIEKFCKKYNIRYAKRKGFFDAVFCFHSYMDKIARDALDDLKQR